jgi:hypothetical protein
MNLFFIKCSDEIIIVENSHETSPNFETRSYQVLILSRSSFLTVISNKIEAGLDYNINQISNWKLVFGGWRLDLLIKN